MTVIYAMILKNLWRKWSRRGEIVKKIKIFIGSDLAKQLAAVIAQKELFHVLPWVIGGLAFLVALPSGPGSGVAGAAAVAATGDVLACAALGGGGTMMGYTALVNIRDAVDKYGFRIDGNHLKN